jgi:cytochrome c556
MSSLISSRFRSNGDELVATEDRAAMKRIGVVTAAIVLALSVSADGQTPATGRLMREKLAHAQKILQALTTSDLRMLEQEAAALSRVTESAHWEVLRSPEFRGHASRFLKISRDLAESAAARDLDAAASHYAEMTKSCYGCHKFLKGSRIAR